jgi:hypothetical protein
MPLQDEISDKDDPFGRTGRHFHARTVSRMSHRHKIIRQDPLLMKYLRFIARFKLWETLLHLEDWFEEIAVFLYAAKGGLAVEDEKLRVCLPRGKLNFLPRHRR